MERDQASQFVNELLKLMNASYNSRKGHSNTTSAPAKAAEPEEESLLYSILHALLKILQQLLGK